MPTSNTLLISALLMLFLSIGDLTASTKEACVPIEIEVHQKSSDRGWGTNIEIDLKNKDISRFNINLMMPKGGHILDAKTLVFSNLESGKYIVVVTSRDENDNYCPTYVNVSIE
ncbi:hypothetical protein MASR2M41_10370 [Flammeovirgaceae bacterium]